MIALSLFGKRPSIQSIFAKAPAYNIMNALCLQEGASPFLSLLQMEGLNFKRIECGGYIG